MYQIRRLHQSGATLHSIRGSTLSRPGWLNLAALTILVVAIWLPRGLALDRLVTPDEKRWLTRSGNFYQALLHGDFANTYQSRHPGVTTMWVGMTVFLWRYPTYASEGPGQQEGAEGEIGAFFQAQGYEPLDMLTDSRVFMVLAITIVLVVTFLVATRLIGFWPALVGFLLIAADPSHVAHSRLLHPDGMASSLVLLALLAFLNHLYRGRRSLDLVLSAVAAGLAWLTKSPALCLIPFVGLLLLFELESKRRREQRLDRDDIRWVVQSFFVWGIVGLSVFVLLWPTMWVDPLYTVWRVLQLAADHAVNAHKELLYFNGAIIDSDPGLYFYPVSYLWRTTPFVLIGLGLAVVTLAAPRTRLIPQAQRRPLAALLIFAALFTVFMSLGAKKFDRYLLPVYPPLDLVAGIGWLAAIGWLHRRWSSRRMQAAAPVIILLVLIGQVGSVVSVFPYYLSYYNPLLGGTTAAPKVMMVGWGEGLDQAAHYLSTRPGASPPPVMIGVWESTFSYFYNGPIRDSDFAPGEDTVHDWMNSDYCVIYINQWQRGQLPKELLDFLASLAPVLVVHLQGLEYIYIYDIRGVPPPDYMLLQPAERAEPALSLSKGEQGARAHPILSKGERGSDLLPGALRRRGRHYDALYQQVASRQ